MLLSVENLTCSYSDKNILNNLSLEIPSGQIVGLIGANGSGKTTLLKCIGNVISYAGNINFFDKGKYVPTNSFSIRQLAQRISYIPQVSGISIDISCLDLVLMGLNPFLGILEKPSTAMKKEAVDILTMLGLEEYIHTSYLELSQGQKQLCLLARTLIGKASLLLLDEPESSLDFGHRHQLISYVRRFIGANRSALITLHDPQLTLNYCDTIKVIADGACIASFEPANTSEADKEAILSKIYGPLCVNSCYNHNGRKQYVVLAE